jgi:putative chitinase
VVTSEQLKKVGIDPKWVGPMNETFDKFNISTIEQQAAFIAQCAHECSHFTVFEENLNYKPEALVRLFKPHFPTMEIANQYAHNPVKIANRAYANRCGNRDEASGDGSMYHGRGAIQLTFHDNYWHCGQACGADFVRNPDLVKTPEYAIMSAGWFWNTHNCNALVNDDLALTKKINGGENGLDQRKELRQQVLKALKG